MPHAFGDDALVQEIRAGSGIAFAHLMRRYERLVHRVAYGFTGDRDEALDVVQETFLKVHSRIHEWRGEGEIRNWIARIAAHEAMNRSRSRRRHGADALEEDRLEPSEPAQEAALHDREARGALQRGGALTLRDVRGEADLTTMGGGISLVDADLDGELSTMGGEVLFENVVGDVTGGSMGGDVRYKNVRRRDGSHGSPPRTGEDLPDAVGETVQISTSMSGDITLYVPAGFGMDLDLEIAFTRNSTQDYRISAPGRLASTTTKEWDREHGSPRKYIRTTGKVNGGGNTVTIRTINGNATVREGI